MTKKYTWVEVNVHADGTVRVYGDGGMIFQVQGDNIKTTASIFPKPLPPSGEGKAKS